MTRVPVPGDHALRAQITTSLSAALGAGTVREGRNCTACTFYASQGRLSDAFDDRNEKLIDSLVQQHPTLTTIEMETFQLFHLAKCARQGRVRAGAACIVIAQRRYTQRRASLSLSLTLSVSANSFLDAEEKNRLELVGGVAMLEALIATPVPDAMDTHECVWKSRKPKA